ncbi:hypothetical protein CsatB_013393 [Cannabis sativa]
MRPPCGSIKIIVDVVVFGSDHKYGIGLVSRDNCDLLIEGRLKLFNGVVRPELAEAIGV